MDSVPKVHKDNVPLRPMVSFIKSPTYELSKHVTSLLSHLVEKIDSFVKNSQGFCSFIKDRRIKQDEVLVSFDVESLFTNVQVE